MFERDHHLRIASVLRALDGEKLASFRCYFGGGTAIALLRGEFRESVDIDFLVSDRECYRELRQRLKRDGLPAITLEKVQQVRDLRIDQYGIRTRLQVGEVEIRLEIVREARIDLEGGGAQICGVQTLSRLDLVASKLLANSDRWADTSSCYRDLIDLAMLEPDRALFLAAVEKAAGGYGEETIRRDLQRVFATLEEHPHRLDGCMESMKMELPKAVLWTKIRLLISRLD